MIERATAVAQRWGHQSRVHPRVEQGDASQPSPAGHKTNTSSDVNGASIMYERTPCDWGGHAVVGVPLEGDEFKRIFPPNPGDIFLTTPPYR